MANLKDILAYYCKHYPYKEELSKARLTKMVYLADWKFASERERQLSDIEWFYNHYGPYVKTVGDVVRDERDIFEIKATKNIQGAFKELITLKDPSYEPSLEEEEKEILESVIKATESFYWRSFIEYVYSTYPIKKSEKFSSLNLVKLASECRKSAGERGTSLHM
jgi:hypothetical protein